MLVAVVAGVAACTPPSGGDDARIGGAEASSSARSEAAPSRPPAERPRKLDADDVVALAQALVAVGAPPDFEIVEPSAQATWMASSRDYAMDAWFASNWHVPQYPFDVTRYPAGQRQAIVAAAWSVQGSGGKAIHFHPLYATDHRVVGHVEFMEAGLLVEWRPDGHGGWRVASEELAWVY